MAAKEVPLRLVDADGVGSTGGALQASLEISVLLAQLAINNPTP